MAWKLLFEYLIVKFFDIITWPSFTLLCPMYASYRAMESDSDSKNQQCLAFWVIFGVFAIMEVALAKFILWLPFWPYVKGMATFLFVITDFGVASYVYKSLMKIYPSESPQILYLIWNVLLMLMEDCFLFFIWLFQRWKCFSSGDADAEEISAVDGQEVFDKPIIWQETLVNTNENAERYHTPIVTKSVQKEWSCALCLISTTSEKCLKSHLKGKKHKAKKEELRAEELDTKLTQNSSSMVNRNRRMVLLGNLVNPETWSGLTGSIKFKLCRWEKPNVGWIKLNTDGSIDKENAGFGGLLRDHYGNAICGFVTKAPLDNIFLVELWAIWRGLVLALGLGIKVIWIESDSMSAVKTISRQQSHSGKGHQCLNHIWALLKNFDNYHISHVWRESNKAADSLSRMILERNDVVLLPVHFPKTLQTIIKDDAQGKIYFRR